MAGRTHRDKSVVAAAAHDFIDRHRDAAHAMGDRIETFRAHRRVGIEMDFALRGSRCLDRINIFSWVNAQDGSAIEASGRGFHAPQRCKARLIKGLGNGAHAVRPFGMAGSRIVAETSEVAEKNRCHNQATLRFVRRLSTFGAHRLWPIWPHRPTTI